VSQLLKLQKKRQKINEEDRRLLTNSKDLTFKTNVTVIFIKYVKYDNILFSGFSPLIRCVLVCSTAVR
jgi:hypothetical protein